MTAVAGNSWQTYEGIALQGFQMTYEQYTRKQRDMITEGGKAFNKQLRKYGKF